MKKTYDCLDWEMFNDIAKNEPHKEHSELQSINDALNNPEYNKCYYLNKDSQNASNGNILLSTRNEKGELIILRNKKRTHELIAAQSGGGKTQSVILNEALNVDGKTSYIFLDPKGEITERAYVHACERYGKENVIIANFMQPEYSNIRINPMAKLANYWLAVQDKSQRVKTKIWDYIVTELRKFVDVVFVVQSNKDPTWEYIAKMFIYAMIIALFEDLTLTPEQERTTNRKKVFPNQINFETISKILSTFSWEISFRDNGFFTKRSEKSLAYQHSKTVISNASNTRSNYMCFVNNYIQQFCDPKIKTMMEANTFNFEEIGNKPQVMFVIFDLSDTRVREFVNIIISNGMSDLMSYSHKIAKPLPVSVVLIADEFPTLEPNPIYTTILSCGRGSNIFMTIAVQSLSQLKARYSDDYKSIIENCAVRIFLGSNDLQTAKEFSEAMGQITLPSTSAFFDGKYMSETVPLVSIDSLMHRMNLGDSYISIDRNMPIHGEFALYFNTPEYTNYPIVSNSSHNLDKSKLEILDNSKLYNLEYLYCNIDDNDVEDEFISEKEDSNCEYSAFNSNKLNELDELDELFDYFNNDDSFIKNKNSEDENDEDENDEYIVRVVKKPNRIASKMFEELAKETDISQHKIRNIIKNLPAVVVEDVTQKSAKKISAIFNKYGFNSEIRKIMYLDNKYEFYNKNKKNNPYKNKGTINRNAKTNNTKNNEETAESIFENKCMDEIEEIIKRHLDNCTKQKCIDEAKFKLKLFSANEEKRKVLTRVIKEFEECTKKDFDKLVKILREKK